MKPMLVAKSILLSLATLVAAPAWAKAPASKPVVWEAALPWPEGSFEHDRFLGFANALKAASQGRLVIKGLAANQHSFPIDRLFEASRAGLVPLSEWILGQASEAEKVTNIGNLLEPTATWDEAWQRYENRRQLLTEALSRQGLVLLYLTPWGPPGLFTREAPMSRDAASGYRVKVYDQFGSQFIEQLGGTAVDIPFSELEQAFKDESVNAVLTSPTNALAAKIYNRTIYFTELKAAFPVNAVVVGRAYMSQLSPADRKLVVQTAVEAEKIAWRSTVARYQAAKESLAAKGIVIITDPPEWLLNATRQVAQEITSQWLTTLPADQSAALRARRAH